MKEKPIYLTIELSEDYVKEAIAEYVNKYFLPRNSNDKVSIKNIVLDVGLSYVDRPGNQGVPAFKKAGVKIETTKKMEL